MKHVTLFILTILFLSACTPLRVVRIEPENEPTSYRYGEKIVTHEQAELSVSASYYDASENYLVFNLEVENLGDEPFNFDPATCTLVPDVGPVTPAIDPELELLSLDMETIKGKRNSRTWAWIGAGVLVAGTVAAITNDNNNVSADFVPDVSFGAELAANVVDAVSFAVIDAAFTGEQVRNAIPVGAEIPSPENRYFWLDHSMRLTTIAPGQKAFGKVVFPRNDGASEFSFQVSVEGKEFAFPFKQRVFRP